jgi:hypothetical protein
VDVGHAGPGRGRGRRRGGGGGGGRQGGRVIPRGARAVLQLLVGEFGGKRGTGPGRRCRIGGAGKSRRRTVRSKGRLFRPLLALSLLLLCPFFVSSSLPLSLARSVVLLDFLSRVCLYLFLFRFLPFRPVCALCSSLPVHESPKHTQHKKTT